jgi:TonB family protein
MSLDLLRHDGEQCRARTRATMGVSVVAHALVLAWLVFFQKPADEREVLTEVTWLDRRDLEPPPPPPPAPAPKPEPTPPAPTPAAPPAARPAARPMHTAAPKPAPAPPPAVPRGNTTIREAPGESGVAARGAAPAGGGLKGRAEGARVARDVQRATADVDRLLSSLGGTLPPAAGGDGGGKPSSGRYTVAGGRGSGDLPSVDGSLRGTGLGEIGAGAGAGGGKGGGRGVHKAGVAIVDRGVESAGDGAGSSGRDSRSLMATVQRYVAGIKFCYDNSLKKAPQLQGKITLQMDIAASGEVSGLQVLDDGLGNPALQRCILSQVESWRFPPIAAGTVRFTLPLVFTPPQGTAP